MKDLYAAVAAFFLVAFLITGCMKEPEQDVRQNIEYTVCDDTRLPDELLKIIKEKQEKLFKLTYISGEYLYIVIGYGAHSSDSYSVVVNDLFLTDNAIYVDTDLKTVDTASDTDAGESSMYPHIVLKCEKIDKPVVFNVD